jgi:hypothetical protein
VALSTIPHTNAQLLRIEAGGFSEDLGRAEGADTVKWSGDVGVYLGERTLTDVSPEGVTEVRQARLRIPTALVNATVEPDDVVVLDQGDGEIERKVRDVKVRDVVGVTILELHDA